MLTDRPSSILRLAALTVLLAFVAPAANAATIIARTDVELTHLSDAVVVAEVEQVAVELNADGAVQTRNTLSVEQWWKGSGPATIDVVQHGGEWEGVTHVLHGDFALKEGTRVVMFLVQDGGAWASTLLSWSVYDVHGSDISAPVTRQGNDLALMKKGDDGRLHETAPVQESKSLGGLKVAVQVLSRKGVE